MLSFRRYLNIRIKYSFKKKKKRNVSSIVYLKIRKMGEKKNKDRSTYYIARLGKRSTSARPTRLSN